MAVIGGDTGTVTWTSKYVENVFAWNGTIDLDTFPYNTFAAADAKGSIQGPHQMNGQLSCYHDDTTVATIPVSGAASTSLVLTASTGLTYTMNATLTQLGPGVSSQAGPNTMTVGFQSDGAIAIAKA